MSAIINALFGTYPDPPPANPSSSLVGQSATSFERIQTSAVGDDVRVQSMISSETRANAAMNSNLNINGLLAQLSTTHAEVDQYSRTRTAEINEQVGVTFDRHSNVSSCLSILGTIGSKVDW